MGGYTRPFAEATRSSSRGLTLDYVNGIQARENHKSVNGMQLNGIRVWQMHNVSALHRHKRKCVAQAVFPSVLHTQLLAHLEPFRGTRVFAGATRVRLQRPHAAAREG